RGVDVVLGRLGRAVTAARQGPGRAEAAGRGLGPLTDVAAEPATATRCGCRPTAAGSPACHAPCGVLAARHRGDGARPGEVAVVVEAGRGGAGDGAPDQELVGLPRDGLLAGQDDGGE